jgi:hypothetical protein
MANLLKLTSIGHAPTNDPNKIENLVAAGLGYSAHVANPRNAGADVIDRAQQAESDVQQTAGFELPHVAHVNIPHSISGSGHTWSTVEKRVVSVDHEVIPWLDRIDVNPTSVFQRA